MPAKPKSGKSASLRADRRKPVPPPPRRRFLGFLFKLALVGLVLGAAWAIYLDAQIRPKFEGQRWALPAQVYARALEIYDGRALNLGNLKHELSLLGYREQAGANRPGTYAVSGRSVTLHSREHRLPDGQHPAQRFSFNLKGDVVADLKALSGEGRELFTLDPFKFAGIYPAIKEERIVLTFDEIPEMLIDALLATEDRDFFTHSGLSIKGIARAMWANVMAGGWEQGGSTLTQQLVKNFYLNRERSLWRKMNEAMMALLLELHYDKNAILETYVNDIFLGQAGATAVHGFGMASAFYFGKPLAECDVQEVALLVAIIKGPSWYDPRKQPKRALERRNTVLALMEEQKMIDATLRKSASAQPLGVLAKPLFQANRYPAFLDLVRRQLKQDYEDEDLRTSGLKIFTTLDPQVQFALEQGVSQRFEPMQKRVSVLQLAGVMTRVGSGEVLAMLGDRDARFQGFNRVLDGERLVGSLIKPAVYLTALMRPEYTLATTLSDEPFTIKFDNGDKWSPTNFDGKTHGDVPLFKGLSQSLNIATARLGMDLGLDNVRETLRLLGVEDAINPYPSLLLGAQALTPFEVAKFYQTIASNGFNMPLRAIREITTAEGEVLQRYPFRVRQVIPTEANYLLQYAMQETMRSGTGKSAYQVLPDALTVAGKTGTTNDNRDSWFAGFSGDYLGVFWVGRDDNQPTPFTGSTGALGLWTQVFSKLPQYPVSTPRPSEIENYWFDQQSWRWTDEECEGARTLPVWGKPAQAQYQPCNSGVPSTIKGWFKSWF